MKFSYTARTKEKKKKKGVIEASTEKAALEVLGKYGFYTTLLSSQDNQNVFAKDLKLFSRVSAKELIMLTRQMGTMLKSAIPPLETIRTLVAQTDNNTLREQLLKISESIETGSTLSQAFGLFPKTFNNFFVSIIKSGEATGKVADSFVYLAQHLENDYEFKQKIVGSLTYPIFIIIVFAMAGLIAIFVIIPKLSDLLLTMGGKLPWPTVVLIAVGTFMKNGGLFLIPFLVVPPIAVFLGVKKSLNFRKKYDRFNLRLPFIGNFLKKFYLVRLGENLSVLIAAGLPITQALKITKEIIGHTVYQEIMEETEARVARGDRISLVFLAHPNEFPPFISQMISTGEETGRLDKILMDTVEFYRKDISRTAEQLATIIEPVLIVTLGLAIAFLAFAVFLPLFNISGGAGSF
ncbi:MAG: type II secretion system F family protein [Candidatus Gribaldobacteria bacterium]|nr:type II secretion system F family protein [Candidatus Gribaldobacteria bacterium]